MDGWKEGRDRRLSKRMDNGWREGGTDEYKDGWMEGGMDGRITDGGRNGWMHHISMTPRKQ